MEAGPRLAGLERSMKLRVTWHLGSSLLQPSRFWDNRHGPPHLGVPICLDLLSQAPSARITNAGWHTCLFI